MKLFFITYWLLFGLGWWAVHSYKRYHQRHVVRQYYLERQRQNLQRLRSRSQLHLF